MSNGRDTSCSTYQDLVDGYGVSNQQQEILKVIALNQDYSLQEISRLSSIPVHIVAGRVNELKKRGVLVEGMRRQCLVTKRTIHPVMKP